MLKLCRALCPDDSSDDLIVLAEAAVPTQPEQVVEFASVPQRFVVLEGSADAEVGPDPGVEDVPRHV